MFCKFVFCQNALDLKQNKEISVLIKMKPLVFLFTIVLMLVFSSTHAQVFISQYVETNSGTTPKGIEIFNATTTDIVFSASNNLQVYQGTNGGVCSALPGTNVTSGTLKSGEVWVIGTSDLTAYAVANGTNLSGTTDFGFAFNGDDALELRLGGVIVDVFGTCEVDPGTAWTGGGVSTANNNLQIKSGICSGTTTYWSDPSLRFDQISVGTDMTGFGTAPVGCVVFSPTIIASPTAISNLNYILGSGPSASQSYSLTGSYLTPATGNIIVTAPANFQVSTDNVSFSNSLTLPYNSSALASTTIYVRLISGLALGSYHGNISNSGGGATTVNVAVSGNVVNPSTAFEWGDFAIIGVNSNIGCISGYGAGDDEISFMTFRDINNGDSFMMTDNGYERVNAGQWGNTEGVIEAVRTGGTIPAGTVITFRFKNGGVYESVSPDANWSITEIHTTTTGTDLILNSGGDQIYFMQGGSWNYGTSSSHNAVYTPGVLLYAFNTNNSWTSFAGSTQESGLVLGMECFSMMPGSATDFIEYTGPVTPATKRDWINRLNDPLNWTNRGDCANYESSKQHFGQTYIILVGGYSAGIWTGDDDTDWFNCGNWQNLEVPDQTVDVLIPSAGVTFEPIIGDPPSVPVPYTTASCSDITVESGRTLTMNHANSSLEVWGNIEQNGTFVASNGIVKILEDNSSLTATNPVVFYNLQINKTLGSNTFTLSNTIAVNNVLTLTKGLIVTGTNMVVVNNTSGASVTAHGFESYICGNLRRYVASTGLYDFPVGTSAFYELANVFLNSSSGLGYIDAFFTNPHSTTINIVPLGIYVNGSLLEELLDYGFWTLTPNAGTYNYDITLTSRGHTNPGPTAESHAVIKRPNGALPWESHGTHNNIDQSMGSGWVTANRRALTNFSDFAIAKSDLGSLPVEMISFNASLRSDDVVVEWMTASEKNNDRFELERSYGDEKDFQTIAIIPGNGNTNTEHQYSFEDLNVPQGVIYYRLKQVDFDGKWDYVGIQAVVHSKEQTSLVISDPVSDNHGFSFNLLNVRGHNVLVELYDITGHLINSKQIYSEASNYRVNVFAVVPQGMYVVRVTDGFSQISQKFVK